MSAITVSVASQAVPEGREMLIPLEVCERVTWIPLASRRASENVRPSAGAGIDNVAALGAFSTWRKVVILSVDRVATPQGRPPTVE